MAVTINDLSKAIRASASDPTGTVLADVTRIHGAASAMIDRYAMAAPEAVKDMAMVQLAQYLYDVSPEQRRHTTSALRESGAAATLAPYRIRRASV